MMAAPSMLGTYVITIAISAVVFALLLLAHKILLGVWAYFDARERNISGDVGWAFVVALVPLYIGLIIYLAVRPSEARRNVCGVCKRSNASDAKFCAGCGAALETAVVVDNRPKKSKGVLVAFFICLGAAFLLFVTMMVSSIIFSVRVAGDAIPELNDYFHGWEFRSNQPGFRFNFDFDAGNNT